jgi:UDP-glucose 4-epimerase
VHGDGLQSRDFTFVANAVDALCKAAWAPNISGMVYNVGTGQSVSLLQVLHLLNEIFAKQLSPEYVAARAGDVRHSRAGITRAQRELLYEPMVSFAEGLGKLVYSC